jgi:transposase
MLAQYQEALDFYINYVWKLKFTRISVNKKTGKETIHIWDTENNHYDCPSMLSTVDIPFENNLSARMLKAAMTQVLGIIRSVTTKYHKKQMVLKRKQASGCKKIKELQSKLDKKKPTKPVLDKENTKAELNSNNICLTEDTHTSFDAYFTLFSLGKDIFGEKYGEIDIPIKYTERSNYWKSKGKMMPSFLLSKDKIEIRWEIKVEENTSVEVVGADGGQNTCLTLSDGVATQKCIHGHDLKSINKKMARKKDGSKAAQEARDHQINYINWSIKQLNLQNYKEIRLESNKNIKKGRKTSKSLRKWSWSSIYKAITLNCEERDVLVSLQNSPYKSQRCSCCGCTHKSNRRGLVFRCLHCGFIANADMNSALNNKENLFVISRGFMATKLNRIGFVWNEAGIFDLAGEAFTVPLVKNG